MLIWIFIEWNSYVETINEIILFIILYYYSFIWVEVIDFN